MFSYVTTSFLDFFLFFLWLDFECFSSLSEEDEQLSELVDLLLCFLFLFFCFLLSLGDELHELLELLLCVFLFLLALLCSELLDEVDDELQQSINSEIEIHFRVIKSVWLLWWVYIYIIYHRTSLVSRILPGSWINHKIWLNWIISTPCTFFMWGCDADDANFHAWKNYKKIIPFAEKTSLWIIPGICFRFTMWSFSWFPLLYFPPRLLRKETMVCIRGNKSMKIRYFYFEFWLLKCTIALHYIFTKNLIKVTACILPNTSLLP